MDMLKELQSRGLLHQVSDEEEVSGKLNGGKVTLYAGFDPTADSLHIGNLLIVLALRRFQLAGHQPIALVGGATGLIGDPGGRTTERTLNTKETVDEWTQKIKSQLERFLDFEAEENPARVVNNYDWIHGLTVIEFLRDVGKSFSVNYMLAKDSVASRLSGGISFTEFSYMILQSYDFLNLNKEYNCILQIGGSDQWGNITAGMELIRKSGEGQAYSLTLPLITKSDGSKFGKSETGTIWLDPTKTSPYQFYQFWINTDDRDVIPFLKYFTFLSEGEIRRIEEELESNPEKRTAQKTLASEVTTLVHGEEAMQRAVKITEVLFNGNIGELTGEEIEEGFKDVPSTTLDGSENMNLVNLLLSANVASSKRQAREDITNGAIYINGDRITNVEEEITESHRVEGKFIVVRRGKKKYHLVKFS